VDTTATPDASGPEHQPATTAPPANPRRDAPTRAEDVLGSGRGGPDSVWWSRQKVAAGDPAPAVVPVPPAPGTTTAGLPARVPMANLPGSGSSPAAVPPPVPDLDPEEMGSTLARFRGGVQQAAAEDDDQPLHAVT
jgi:hypothetical protein